MYIPRRITTGKKSSVGLSWIDADAGSIGNQVRIGHLNVFRRIKKLSIGSDSYILNSNHFFGTRSYPDFPATLSIGEQVGIMSRHFIDVSGTVEIADRAILAGRDTHLWSHTLTPKGDLRPLSIRIGEGCYVGARCTLVGCSIPDNWVVAAGSVVVGSFEPGPTRCLIAGNPAKVVKRYEDHHERD